MTMTLPEWVQRGTPVEIVHYNATGDHVHTIPTTISYVGARDIIVEFDMQKRFTRSMYRADRDVFERFGEGLRPHRYVLRRKLAD